MGSEHLVPDKTQRGFKAMPPIAGLWATRARVVESSLATDTAVWLFAASPSDLNNPGSPLAEVGAHLTIDDAKRLAEQLLWLAENHYQLVYDEEDT